MNFPKTKALWIILLILAWIDLCIWIIIPHAIDKFFNPTCWIASLNKKDLIDLEISLCDTASLRETLNNSWTDLIQSGNKQIPINKYILNWLKNTTKKCRKYEDTKKLIEYLENITKH